MQRHKFLQIPWISLVALLLVSCALPTPTPITVVVTPITVVVATTRAPAPVSPTAVSLQLGTPFPSTPVSLLPTVQGTGEYPVVQLMTKQGGNISVEVNRVSMEGDLLLQMLLRGQYDAICLEVAPGAYIIIPWSAFRRAYERDGLQVVTLADGRELEGRLIGSIVTRDWKTYAFSDVTAVVLNSLPRQTPVPRSATQPSPWQTQFTQPVGFTGRLFDPKFWFNYYSTEGFAAGGSNNRQASSTSFYVKVGSEETLANLTDVDEIGFNGTHVNVRTRSGIETTGTLVLRTHDSKGDHNGERWFLVMKIPDGELVLALNGDTDSGLIGTLRKESP